MLLLFSFVVVDAVAVVVVSFGSYSTATLVTTDAVYIAPLPLLFLVANSSHLKIEKLHQQQKQTTTAN